MDMKNKYIRQNNHSYEKNNNNVIFTNIEQIEP